MPERPEKPPFLILTIMHNKKVSPCVAHDLTYFQDYELPEKDECPNSDKSDTSVGASESSRTEAQD